MLSSPYATTSAAHPMHPLYKNKVQWGVQRKTLPPWKDTEQWSPTVQMGPRASAPSLGQSQQAMNADGSIRPGFKLAVVPDPAYVLDPPPGSIAVTAGAKHDKKKGRGKGNKSKDKGKGKGSKDKRKGDHKDGDKGKDGKRQKGDGKIAVPPIAGATPSPPIQPILSGELPKVEIPKTENQKKGADAQWIRDALCFASADLNPSLSRKATKRVKYVARELHRTAPILLPSHEAVKASVVAALEKEIQKAERETARMKAKALVAAQLEAAANVAPSTNAGLENTMSVDAVALGETKSKEELEESEGSDGDSDLDSSNDSDDADMKPAHAVKVPIPSDGKFWICEIPLTDLENQNAIRMLSHVLTELTERTATRASYVTGLCIAQSVVFGATPLQLTKANYEAESAKVAKSVNAINAEEPVGLAASSASASAETADMTVDSPAEVAKSA